MSGLDRVRGPERGPASGAWIMAVSPLYAWKAVEALDNGGHYLYYCTRVWVPRSFREGLALSDCGGAMGENLRE